MAKIKNDDLVLIGRGGASYYTTALELVTYVESADVLTYRGTLDLTATPSGQLDPDPPVTGDLYLSSTAGTVNAGFSGMGGQTTEVGDRAMWNGTAWALIASGASDVGVTNVEVTAPITKGGTDAQPNIGIATATNAAFGSARLCQDPPNSGNQTSTSDDDVLNVRHFNQLASRISTAASGGVQTVSGSNGLTSSGTTDITVSGINATTATVGVVMLDDTVENSSTKAATPKSVMDWSVPQNLALLTELT